MFTIFQLGLLMRPFSEVFKPITRNHLINSGCFTYFTIGYMSGFYANIRVPDANLALGFVMWIIGEIINGYHHYLLSQLRTPTRKEYKIPEGGLFEYVVCPHYLGTSEITPTKIDKNLRGNFAFHWNCCHQRSFIFLYFSSSSSYSFKW